MTTIDVLAEHEADRGWCFDCRLGDAQSVQLTLAWVDYNHWCPDGGRSPSDVAEAALACLVNVNHPVPETLDAGRIRHLCHDADARIRAHLADTD